MIRLNLMISYIVEGDYIVIVSPDLSVSGYGKSEDEALQSFEHNLSVLLDDILNILS